MVGASRQRRPTSPAARPPTRRPPRRRPSSARVGAGEDPRTGHHPGTARRRTAALEGHRRARRVLPEQHLDSSTPPVRPRPARRPADSVAVAGGPALSSTVPAAAACHPGQLRCHRFRNACRRGPRGGQLAAPGHLCRARPAPPPARPARLGDGQGDSRAPASAAHASTSRCPRLLAGERFQRGPPVPHRGQPCVRRRALRVPSSAAHAEPGRHLVQPLLPARPSRVGGDSCAAPGGPPRQGGVVRPRRQGRGRRPARGRGPGGQPSARSGPLSPPRRPACRLAGWARPRRSRPSRPEQSAPRVTPGPARSGGQVLASCSSARTRPVPFYPVATRRTGPARPSAPPVRSSRSGSTAVPAITPSPLSERPPHRAAAEERPDRPSTAIPLQPQLSVLVARPRRPGPGQHRRSTEAEPSPRRPPPAYPEAPGRVGPAPRAGAVR